MHGLHHDIMHDLYKGVVPYEVKLLLRHYDFHDNKPTLIDERVFNSQDRRLCQSASQMMTLVHELPLISEG